MRERLRWRWTQFCCSFRLFCVVLLENRHIFKVEDVCWRKSEIHVSHCWIMCQQWSYLLRKRLKNCFFFFCQWKSCRTCLPWRQATQTLPWMRVTHGEEWQIVNLQLALGNVRLMCCPALCVALIGHMYTKVTQLMQNQSCDMFNLWWHQWMEITLVIFSVTWWRYRWKCVVPSLICRLPAT